MDETPRVTLTPVQGTVRILLDGVVLVESSRVIEMQESDYIPRFYFPAEDVNHAVLTPSDHATTCPHKGDAAYFSFNAEGVSRPNIAWTYPSAGGESAGIQGMFAFFEERLDVEGP